MVSGERSYFLNLFTHYTIIMVLWDIRSVNFLSVLFIPAHFPCAECCGSQTAPGQQGLCCGAPQTHTCAQQRVLTGTWKLQRFGSVQKLLQLHHQTSWLSLQEQGASHVCSVHLLRVMFAPRFHPLPSLACSVLSFSVVLWGF